MLILNAGRLQIRPSGQFIVLIAHSALPLCLHKPKSRKAQKKSTSQQVNKSTNALFRIRDFRCLISYILYIL